MKTCALLGKALAVDRTFTHVKLNDCMLAEEGWLHCNILIILNLINKCIHTYGHFYKKLELTGKCKFDQQQILRQADIRLKSMAYPYSDRQRLDQSGHPKQNT